MNLSKKRTIIFIIITFVITWAAEFMLWKGGGLKNPRVQIYLSIIMMIPMIGSFLTRWITKEGLENLWLRLDFKANIKTYLIAWFGPALLILFGSALYYLIFPAKFDPEMSVLRQSLNALGEQQTAELTTQKLLLSILSQVLLALIMSPILNAIPCLGEEIGWRAYLLPKLADFLPRKKAVVISGVVWGIWHAPIIAMGHNYGENYPFFPWLGIIGMILFCVFVGSFLAWLTFRMESALPAAIAHGAVNGMAAVGIFFLKGTPEPFLGPYPVGIVGGFGFIVIGILCYLNIEKAKPLQF